VDPAVLAAIRAHLPSDPAAARGGNKALAVALATLLGMGYLGEVAHQDAGQAHRDAQAQTVAIQRLEHDVGQKVPEIVRDAVQQALHPGATGAQPGRNDPCWCGSGVKFKKCHG
jgi:hypothetical protein